MTGSATVAASHNEQSGNIHPIVRECKNRRKVIRLYPEEETPVKKYICANDCGSSFAHRRSLTKHLRYECQQKPRFKCPSCDFLSRWTSDVYRHVRRKHEGSVVQCIDLGQNR